MLAGSPAISAVQRPSYAMGVRGTEVLLARLAGDGPAAREHTLPNLIIDRESIGAVSSTMVGPSSWKGSR